MDSQPPFLKLNDVALRVICGKLDFYSILTLRKVSRGIRKFIDIEKPKSDLTHISFTFGSEKVILYLSTDKQSMFIDYQKEENGCSVVCRGKKIPIEGEDVLNILHEDLKIILNFQKTPLKYFCICFQVELENLEQLSSGFYSKLHNILKGREHQLQVQILSLEAVGQEQVLEVLPFFDPNKLRSLSLSDPNSHKSPYDIDKIVVLDQWKQVQEFSTKSLIMGNYGSIQSFCHFLRTEIYVESVTANEVFVLKEAFLQLPNFVDCPIHFKNFDDQDNLLKLLGPTMELEAYGVKGRQWIFHVPDSELIVCILIVSCGLIDITRDPLAPEDFAEHLIHRCAVEYPSDEEEDSDVGEDSDASLDFDISLD